MVPEACWRYFDSECNGLYEAVRDTSAGNVMDCLYISICRSRLRGMHSKHEGWCHQTRRLEIQLLVKEGFDDHRSFAVQHLLFNHVQPCNRLTIALESALLVPLRDFLHELMLLPSPADQLLERLHWLSLHRP